MDTTASTGNWVDPKTGVIYDSKEWIIHTWNGKTTRVKRASPKQVAFITSLEYQLGYKPVNHDNLAAYKAVKMIERLQARLKTKTLPLELS